MKKGQQEDEKLLFPPETEATSPEYREFLTQFFTELYDLLKAEKLLTKSFFHVSDEPHGDEHRANYQAARKMLKEIAPWMKTMDALSEIAYGREKITDMPVPSIRTAVQFYNEGKVCPPQKGNPTHRNANTRMNAEYLCPFLKLAT